MPPPTTSGWRSSRSALRSGRPARSRMLEDVPVVLLEGERERHHVEVAQRPARLDRPRLPAVLRQEGPLAGRARIGVEEAVDGVQAEVGHPEPVGVRVHERDAQAAAGLLADRAALAGRLEGFQDGSSVRRPRRAPPRSKARPRRGRERLVLESADRSPLTRDPMTFSPKTLLPALAASAAGHPGRLPDLGRRRRAGRRRAGGRRAAAPSAADPAAVLPGVELEGLSPEQQRAGGRVRAPGVLPLRLPAHGVELPAHAPGLQARAPHRPPGRPAGPRRRRPGRRCGGS